MFLKEQRRNNFLIFENGLFKQFGIVSQGMWDQLQNDINVFWLVNMGALVFLMQLAFPLLESGMFDFFLLFPSLIFLTHSYSSFRDGPLKKRCEFTFHQYYQYMCGMCGLVSVGLCICIW